MTGLLTLLCLAGQQVYDIVEVRFKNSRKSFYRNSQGLSLQIGDVVIVETSPGYDVGVVSVVGELARVQVRKKAPNLKPMEIKKILRIANQEEIDKWIKGRSLEKDLMYKARTLAMNLNMEMKISDVEYQGDLSKATFYYTAEGRVDFRQLIKDMADDFKVRIEMRQIGSRQESSRLGGIGSCGRELCCSSFLTKYGNVNIKMAKNQNLSLIYNKLNGVCGQLKCCLQYEDEVYFHKRKKLPQEGSFIQTKNGDKGRVERLHLLPEQFDMLTESGAIRRYALHQFHYKSYLPESYQLPQIDHVSDETAVVVGLEEEQQIKIRKFEEDIERIKSEAPKFTDNVWRELKGEEVVSTPVEAPAQTNQQHGHQHGQHQGPRQERHHHNNNQRHHNHHRHHNDRKPGHGRNGNSNGNSNNEE
jgi:cell fate regulator YaaT (PSP1 superfamily)